MERNTAEGPETLTPASPHLHLTTAKIPGILHLPGCYLLLSLPLSLFISLTSKAQVSQAQALIRFAFLFCLLVTVTKWASHPWALLGTPGSIISYLPKWYFHLDPTNITVHQV